jgi:hypothetical protein
MAGRGPAPKLAGQRRHRGQPQRGEWVDLAPIDKPVLPPANKDWSAHAQRLWNAWRKDPVSATFGPGDVVALQEFARLYDDLAPNEQRLRMDGFGLTPKGRRDLRLRLPSETEQPGPMPLASVTPLRIEDPRGVKSA